MKNVSIFEPQIEKHHAYKKNMYSVKERFFEGGVDICIDSAPEIKDPLMNRSKSEESSKCFFQTTQKKNYHYM